MCNRWIEFERNNWHQFLFVVLHTRRNVFYHPLGLYLVPDIPVTVHLSLQKLEYFFCVDIDNYLCKYLVPRRLKTPEDHFE
jgi:hypothetical protein